jgi:hypothetical protein
MERVESLDTVEGHEQLRAWRRGALPITGWAIGQGSPAGLQTVVPVVTVSMRARPDVQDLARVHLIEGPGYEGDVWSQWIFVTGQAPPWVLLDVRLKRPVHCQFKLAFRADKHRLVLDAAARSGLIGIALKPLSIDANGIARGPMLFIEVMRQDLRHVLNMWAVLNALGLTEKAA